MADDPFKWVEMLADPPIATPTGVANGAETALWNGAQYTPIPAGNPTAAKIYRLCAAGTLTLGLTTTTITITPRIGTTVAGGTTLGASVVKVAGLAFTAAPWWLDFTMVCQSSGAPGTTSGVIGEGLFYADQTTAVNGAFSMTLGGTLATADFSILQAITVGATITATGTMTTTIAFIQSLN